jgi:predicted NAD/FAD-binding protein
VRISVVGAWIAGVGAAWALTRAGFAVDVFEARDEVGGNAKTHRWDARGGPLVAGLAVLAWPEAYFHNYGRLLDVLSIPSEEVRLRYFVRRGREHFAHERGGPLLDRHARDLEKWQRMIARLRGVNRRFAGDDHAPSLYRVSYANPLTYLPAWLVARAHGISRAFWDDLVVAIYATSFLTTRLDPLPAVILPVLDDLISLADGGRMRSWRGHSGEVFDAMLRDLRGTVHRGRPIVEIHGDRDRVTLRAADGERFTYDHAILAGDAERMSAALAEVHRGAKRLLAGVRYVERRDETFADGVAHGDASLLPAAHRDTILRETCTFVDVVDAPAGRRYENHFVVSSWAPVARDRDVVMIASYGLAPGRAIAGPVRAFSNRGGHPELSLANLLIGRRLRRWQGRDRLHYCGAYTTPGNGHDLSLLSGFVVAAALGAPHPFADDPAASRDFARLRAMMLG